jgi:uncharacterized protein (DUF2147 family)
LAALLLASTAARADPSGEWRVADGTATIRIHRCGGGAYCGNVVATITPAGKDVRNPNPAKRNRSVLGLEVLINLRPAGQNRWSGMSYNTEDGQMYTTTISLQSESALNVQGCSPGGGSCGNETWSRVR